MWNDWSRTSAPWKWGTWPGLQHIKGCLCEDWFTWYKLPKCQSKKSQPEPSSSGHSVDCQVIVLKTWLPKKENLQFLAGPEFEHLQISSIDIFSKHCSGQWESSDQIVLRPESFLSTKWRDKETRTRLRELGCQEYDYTKGTSTNQWSLVFSGVQIRKTSASCPSHSMTKSINTSLTILTVRLQLPVHRNADDERPKIPQTHRLHSRNFTNSLKNGALGRITSVNQNNLPEKES